MSNGIRQKLRETCRDEGGLGLETDGRSFCGGGLKVNMQRLGLNVTNRERVS